MANLDLEALYRQLICKVDKLVKSLSDGTAISLKTVNGQSVYGQGDISTTPEAAPPGAFISSQDETLVYGDSVFTFTGTTPKTWKLPDPSNPDYAGRIWLILNSGTANLTIASVDGSNDFYIAGTMTDTFMLMPTENCRTGCNTMYWVIIGQ